MILYFPIPHVSREVWNIGGGGKSGYSGESGNSSKSVLGKLGPCKLGPKPFFVANWAPANRAPANWAPADWAPANRAPADWAPRRQIGPRNFFGGSLYFMYLYWIYTANNCEMLFS